MNMAMVRQGTFVGRLVREPDAPKVLPNSGTTLVKFTIVCGRSKKNQHTGEWEEDPNALWLDCSVFSNPNAKFNMADFVSRNAKKGETVFVSGELKQDNWEDKNGGGKRSKVVCEVREFQLLGGKGDGGAKEPLDAADPGETFKPRQQPQRHSAPVSDDDTPF